MLTYNTRLRRNGRNHQEPTLPYTLTSFEGSLCELLHIDLNAGMPLSKLRASSECTQDSNKEVWCHEAEQIVETSWIFARNSSRGVAIVECGFILKVISSRTKLASHHLFMNLQR
jgi:hypothetical protein